MDIKSDRLPPAVPPPCSGPSLPGGLPLIGKPGAGIRGSAIDCPLCLRARSEYRPRHQAEYVMMGTWERCTHETASEYRDWGVWDWETPSRTKSARLPADLPYLMAGRLRLSR